MRFPLAVGELLSNLTILLSLCWLYVSKGAFYSFQSQTERVSWVTWLVRSLERHVYPTANLQISILLYTFFYSFSKNLVFRHSEKCVLRARFLHLSPAPSPPHAPEAASSGQLAGSLGVIVGFSQLTFRYTVGIFCTSALAFHTVCFMT